MRGYGKPVVIRGCVEQSVCLLRHNTCSNYVRHRNSWRVSETDKNITESYHSPISKNYFRSHSKYLKYRGITFINLP